MRRCLLPPTDPPLSNELSIFQTFSKRNRIFSLDRKAVLLAGKVQFPYIHDLAELLTLLERSGKPVPSHVKEATWLTRYPGLAEPIMREEYEVATRIAETVVNRAESQVRGK